MAHSVDTATKLSRGTRAAISGVNEQVLANTV
jgi:hypothetical protein